MDVAIGARSMDKLHAVAQRVEATGRRALAMPCDVTSDGAVDAFIAAAHERFGRLDAAFANAGYGLHAAVEDTSDEQMRRIFETNYYGTLRVIRAAVPLMRQAGRGHLLICSSVLSEIGLPLSGAYCATKAAQKSIADALRAELHDEGIAVSSVHPIGTRSKFFDRVAASADESRAPFSMHSSMMQSCDRVADAIVRCLRRPTAQVWPHRPTRLGLAVALALPGLGAAAMRRMMRRMRAESRGAPALRVPDEAPRRAGREAV
jgi:short-subunit dehydrogenase